MSVNIDNPEISDILKMKERGVLWSYISSFEEGSRRTYILNRIVNLLLIRLDALDKSRSDYINQGIQLETELERARKETKYLTEEIEKLESTVKYLNERINLENAAFLSFKTNYKMLEDKLNRISNLLEVSNKNYKESHLSEGVSRSEKRIEQLCELYEKEVKKNRILLKKYEREKKTSKYTEAMHELILKEVHIAARNMFFVYDGRLKFGSAKNYRYLVMTRDLSTDKNEVISKFDNKDDAYSFCEWKRAEYVTKFQTTLRDAQNLS